MSVDSDVMIDATAIRQLVRRFTRAEIAAAGGWVDVRNKHDNWLTRMQTVKYWYAYFAMRNIAWAFQRVLCLSGCLTAYRRSVLVELEPVLERRALLGVPIKYGDDRWRVRAWPAHQRVGALSFVAQALVMPVTYGLLTPLALFTLDSGSWETRGHDAGAGPPSPAVIGRHGERPPAA